jgi:FkbM family methyltransferase
MLVAVFLRRIALLVPRRLLAAVNAAQLAHPILQRALRPLARSVSAGEGLIHAGPAAGLRIDATGRNAGYVLGTSETEVQTWLADILRRGDVFWDLGANIGFFTLLGARLVGPEGTVVAFEPWPQNAEQLQRNAELNGFTQVVTERVAVSSQVGIASFTLPEGRRDAGALGAGKSGTTISVPTTTMDAYAAGAARPPNVVKIDVEGAELDVLRGGLSMLAAHRPILLVEVHWLGSAFADFVENELASLGYALTRVSESLQPTLPAEPDLFHVLLEASAARTT